MKAKMFFLAVCLMGGLFTKAQISIGFKTGVNFADAKLSGITESLLPDANNITTPMAGINIQYRITEQLSFQPEINFVQRGFQAHEGFEFNVLDVPIPVGVKAITKINYVEMPLQLKYKFTTGVVQPYILAGPSISYASSGTVREVANLIIDINIGQQNINLNNSNFNRWEAGGKLAAGLAFKTILGEIQLEGGYYHSLTDFFRNPIVDVHAYNKGLNFQLGWCYNF
jgi:hypothetical protein